MAVRADSAAKACAERVEVVYSEVSEAVDEQRRLIGDAEVCAAVHQPGGREGGRHAWLRSAAALPRTVVRGSHARLRWAFGSVRQRRRLRDGRRAGVHDATHATRHARHATRVSRPVGTDPQARMKKRMDTLRKALEEEVNVQRCKVDELEELVLPCPLPPPTHPTANLGLLCI